MNTVLWTPTDEAIQRSNLKRFASFFCDRLGIATQDNYAALHDLSVKKPGPFWRAVAEFAAIDADLGPFDVEQSPEIRAWQWFPSGRLNFADVLLQSHRLNDPAFADSIAIYTSNEAGEEQQISRIELYRRVQNVATFLRSLGVGPGDRVVAVIPNIAESVIGMLAVSAIGAIWSSCSPEFGDDAICDRFGQIEPRVLLTTASARYNGKAIQPIDKVLRVLPRLTTLEHLVVIGDAPDLSKNRDVPDVSTHRWEDAIQTDGANFRFERFPFSQPLYILYSSGTTGIPKCIVHGAGGTLLQHLKEHVLHCDIHSGDTLFYYTTTGWMMWNWLVSGLAAGASIVLYDGSPLVPGDSVLWKLADSAGITHFGASPRYYVTLEKNGYRPKDNVSLNRLRTVLSTGSPLLPETFEWIYDAVGTFINLASISGGTDIVSCFLVGNPTLPVHRGEIQCKALGMNVQVFSDEGHPLVNEPGELVCTNAFPSMPLRFWNDEGGRKYKAAYFEKFENVWCHGDWAVETEHGGFIIYGRSDATLNPSGVRIGTAEIYQQVETFAEVTESLATVLRSEGDERVVLFVRMVDGHTLTNSLIEAICKRLRERCSARHVPAWIAAAPDFPRTISGKLSEIAVRSAINGANLGNAGALANPESLAYFRSWRPDTLTSKP